MVKILKQKTKLQLEILLIVLDLADLRVKSIIYLIKYKKSQILNCGYGIGFSILQIINSLNKILKKPIKYKFWPEKKRRYRKSSS